MQLGMIGLGRMGANLVRRLMRDGHECVVYDVDADAVATLAGEGATAALMIRQYLEALGARARPEEARSPLATQMAAAASV